MLAAGLGLLACEQSRSGAQAGAAILPAHRPVEPAVERPAIPSASQANPRRPEAPSPPLPRPSGGARLGVGPGWEDVPLPGFEPVIVAVPPGDDKKPLFVVAHGYSDLPRWQCAWWQQRVGSEAWVVCPRGIPVQALAPGQVGYQFSSPSAMEAEILAAIGAVRARYAPRVDAASPVFAGFSQGAIFGAELAAKGHFRRMILVEGGVGGWTAAHAQAFRSAGGERVLFACGQPGCAAWAQRSVETLVEAGVAARTVSAFGGGHRYRDTPLEPLLFSSVDWVLKD
ncbi:MAG: hypothetical protein MUF64_15290 [Polyangiaceae bacterium]|jgi:hypothetical protein|nr:hypothetical protein [Polyangiaceae bacterium]